LTFSEETQSAAERNLERIKSGLRPAAAAAPGLPPGAAAELSTQAESTHQAFTTAMDDDFNTAGALAAVFELIKAVNTARDSGATDDQLATAQATLRALTGVFGLRLQEKQGTSEQVAQIEALIAERNAARQQKQWALSDQIRDKLKELGVAIEDSKEGTSWRWG
jgi:cysteinyl-tRNA synthetase